MNKYFFVKAAAVGIALLLTGCSGNTGDGSAAADDIVTINAESLSDSQKGNKLQQESPQSDLAETISEEIMSEEIMPENKIATQTEIALTENDETGEQAEMKMNVQIGDYTFTATLENNTAVEELMAMMKEGPVTIQMNDYSGFEKVGPLGRSLTTSNSQTTTSAGDIVLYNGNNIVMFYGSNSWSYTRIGKIDDLTDWEKALGSGSITAVFTLE